MDGKKREPVFIKQLQLLIIIEKGKRLSTSKRSQAAFFMLALKNS